MILHEERIPGYYYGPPIVVANLMVALQRKNIHILMKSIQIHHSLNKYSYLKEHLYGIGYILMNISNIVKSIKSSNIIDIHYLKPINSIIYANMARMLGKPVVLHVYFQVKNTIWISLLKRNVRLFVVLNQYMANSLVNMGIQKEKIEIIFPAINTDVFKPISKKSLLEKYNIPLNKFILLYHGRPSTVRGLMLFLRSLLFLRNKFLDLFVVLSLADVKDEDLSLEDIKNFNKKNGLDTMVSLIVGKNDPVEMYNLADIVVFPFMKKEAAMCPPLSVPEAMACQKIIVSSDIEELGIRHIIKNGYNGFLIEPTEDDLIACIEKIRPKDGKALDQIAYFARRTIQDQYSSEVVANKFIMEIERIC